MLAAEVLASAQTVVLPCPAGSNTPYSYVPIVGGSWDQFSQTPSVETGFAIKTGVCSNSFIVTTIGTQIGQNVASGGTANVAVHYEYHVARFGHLELIGDAQTGAAQVTSSASGVSTTATQAMFGGGAGLLWDFGGQLSKGKWHLQLGVHADYLLITSTQAKPYYPLELRLPFESATDVASIVVPAASRQLRIKKQPRPSKGY